MPVTTDRSERGLPGVNPPIDGARRGTAFACVVAMTASVGVAWQASGFGVTGMAIPVNYDGDGLSALALVKNTLEHGWYTRFPELGAPFGTHWLDFPLAESAHFAVIRLLGLLGASPATAVNLFFLLGFAAATASAYLVLRRWRIAPPLAAAAAIAFSWLPFHFLRAGHLFLASYYTIPVYAHLAMLAYEGRLGEAFSLARRPLATMGWCALLVVCASSGLYYAFFGCVLIGFGGLAAAWNGRNLKQLARPLLAMLVIVLALAGNFLGSLMFRVEAGPNPAVAVRQPFESEVFGLRAIQLLLPTPEHRVPALAALTESYGKQTPGINENATASLGVAGAAGFLLSVAALLLAHRRRDEMLARLGAFNLAALLYGTVGGFGTVFAFAVSPQIRALNRISVFIAFFSLAALAHALQLLLGKVDGERKRTASAVSLAVALILLAWFDQIPQHLALGTAVRTERFRSDASFAHRTAALLPERGCVYQLPYIPFPEEPPRFREGTYAMLRPYLHSTAIGWSAGAMRGRDADRWLAEVDRVPLGERVNTLAAAGFGAVFVQRDAYDDGGSAIEEELRTRLGQAAVVSDDRLRALYLLPAAPAGSPVLAGSRCRGRDEAAVAQAEPGERPATTPEPAQAVELDQPLPRDSIAVALSLAGPPEHLAAVDQIALTIRIGNEGSATLSPRGKLPVAMGLMLLAPDGSPDHAPGNRDFLRARIPQIGPGGSGVATLRFPAAAALGRKLRVQLVQEHVAWFDAYGLISLDLGPFERCARDAGRICGPDGKPL